MGAIVKRWITYKLGLEIPSPNDPAEFRRELANGILVAEILRKYGLLSDDEFVSLRHNNSKKSRANNMLAIHNWLTLSGMNISLRMLMDVAGEGLGAGVKFLYELYLWLEDGPRKPEVGDRARKYLQKKSFSVASAERSRSRISSMRTSGQEAIEEAAEEEPEPEEPEPEELPIQRKWERSLSLTDEERPPFIFQALPEFEARQPNWYTTLDPVKAPSLLVQRAPFAEVGEASQAENLYFTSETINILKRQKRVKEQFEALRKEKKLERPQDETPPCEGFTFRLEDIKERQQQSIEKVKADKVWEALKEIEKFDANQKNFRKCDKPTTVSRKRKGKGTVLSGRVYFDGRGDAEQCARSVQAIKCRRREEAEESEARVQMRRAAGKRLAREIPATMFSILEKEVLESVSRLPSAERLLADFIYNGHMERSAYIEHAIYEARQLEACRELDLAKQFIIEKADEEVRLELAGFKMEAPDREIQDPDRKALNEDNIWMADSILMNLAELVARVSGYRASAGKGCFVTDKAKYSAPDDVSKMEYRVVLDGDTFVMEPSTWSSPGTGFDAAPPPMLLTTPEMGWDDTQFLIKHISVMLDRFLHVASGSLIPTKSFTFIIEDLILLSIRCRDGEPREYLPPGWLRLTPPQVRKLVGLLMGKTGFINWRNFLIACLDIPYPDQMDIMATIQQFQEVDPMGSFYINKAAFDQVSLWFEPKSSCSLSQTFQHLHLREVLFYMFADVNGYFYYIDFLLYYSKDQILLLGIIKALTVLTGRYILSDELRKRLQSTSDESTTLLSDSDIDLFFANATVRTRRDSTVPPNTPKHHQDFSSRMASMRQKYQLFTAGTEAGKAPVTELEDSDQLTLRDLLLQEEDKTGASRLVESENKRRKKSCLRNARHGKKKRKHEVSRRPSTRLNLKFRDIDRLKKLIEQELHVEVLSSGTEEEMEDEGGNFADNEASTASTAKPTRGTGSLTSVRTRHESIETGTQTAKTTSPLTLPSSAEGEGAFEYLGEAYEFLGEGGPSEAFYTQGIPYSNTIPSEAFLQAIWFGHITAFPVHDPSFMSEDYLKYKEFLEVAYEQLYDKSPVMDGEIYVSYLNQILEHPFVKEVIKRFTTYKIVDLRALLKEVSVSIDGYESGSTASPPKTEESETKQDSVEETEAEGHPEKPPEPAAVSTTNDHKGKKGKKGSLISRKTVDTEKVKPEKASEPAKSTVSSRPKSKTKEVPVLKHKKSKKGLNK